MLVIPNVNPIKNSRWARETPNEAFINDPGYETIATNFAKKAGVPGPYRWFEVRVLNEKSVVDIADAFRWWNEPAWMERIFWVYSKPITFEVDGKNFQTYCLEFFESQRVLEGAIRKFGKNPFEDPFPAMLIPCDCVRKAWFETANGFSEHLRPREEAILSQEDLDREARTQAEIKKLSSQIENIAAKPYGGDDPKGFV